MDNPFKVGDKVVCKFQEEMKLVTNWDSIADKYSLCGTTGIYEVFQISDGCVLLTPRVSMKNSTTYGYMYSRFKLYEPGFKQRLMQLL